jgi:hypothetical protein
VKSWYRSAVPLFEPVFAQLNSAGVRYVVVGGLATVLHGFARLTADVDLALDLEPEALVSAVSALKALGLRPRAPVSLDDFADPATRRRWIEEKGLTVLSLWDPSRPMLEVDVFAENPISFDDLWSRSELVEIRGVGIRIAGIADLIRLKRLAGRPEDFQDIEALEAILAKRGP